MKTTNIYNNWSLESLKASLEDNLRYYNSLHKYCKITASGKRIFKDIKNIKEAINNKLN